MSSALIAEAIAKAEDDLGLRSSYVNNAEYPPVHFVGRDSSATHVRLDIHNAALRHLAERAAKAEAERATLVQALRRVRDEVTHARDHGSALYMLHKHTERALSAVGEDPRKGSGAYAEKGAPRG